MPVSKVAVLFIGSGAVGLIDANEAVLVLWRRPVGLVGVLAEVLVPGRADCLAEAHASLLVTWRAAFN